MKYVDVRFRLPDWMLHPMAAFIRNEDVVRYEELLAWNVRPGEELEYELFYVEADPGPYREAIDEVDSVVDYRIAPIDESSFHVWSCQRTRPETRAWRDAFADRRLVVVPPIRFDEEAAMSMTIVGEGEDVSTLLEDVPSELDVTVAEIGTYDRRGGTLAGALTDRQLDAVGAALRIGYYEVPRGGSLADVAAELGCAESTASVLLRRAERAVFSRLLRRYGGTVVPAAGSSR